MKIQLCAEIEGLFLLKEKVTATLPPYAFELFQKDGKHFISVTRPVNNYLEFAPKLFVKDGIVNIEAQTAGLKCITSTAVPAEVDVTGNVERISLDQPIGVWADKVLQVPTNRIDYSDIIREHGFDMRASALELEHIYEEVISK